MQPRGFISAEPVEGGRKLLFSFSGACCVGSPPQRQKGINMHQLMTGRSNSSLAIVQSQETQQFPESCMCFSGKRFVIALPNETPKSTPRMTEQQLFFSVFPLRVRQKIHDVSCHRQNRLFCNNIWRETAYYTTCTILCVSMLIGN